MIRCGTAGCRCPVRLRDGQRHHRCPGQLLARRWRRRCRAAAHIPRWVPSPGRPGRRRAHRRVNRQRERFGRRRPNAEVAVTSSTSPKVTADLGLRCRPRAQNFAVRLGDLRSPKSHHAVEAEAGTTVTTRILTWPRQRRYRLVPIRSAGDDTCRENRHEGERPRRASSTSCTREAKAKFGVDVGEVGLHSARRTAVLQCRGG